MPWKTVEPPCLRNVSLNLALPSVLITSLACCQSALLNEAALPMGCGNTVTWSCAMTPCSASLSQLYSGIPRRLMATAPHTSWLTFSRSDSRLMRSAVRASGLCVMSFQISGPETTGTWLPKSSGACLKLAASASATGFPSAASMRMTENLALFTVAWNVTPSGPPISSAACCTVTLFATVLFFPPAS
ncbi:MAG: hypothetical protein JW395_0313 [Nitrospira sp.]|nr:hypothetical protein [Nitrospira sp.]